MEKQSSPFISITANEIHVTINGRPSPFSSLESLLGSLGGVAVVQTGGDTDTGETGPVTDGGVAGQAPAADPVAPVAEAVVQTASADADKIMLYLQNDTRWAWRTADGIATDLEVDAGLVGEALDALVTKGSLRRKAKRDDATVKVYALVPAAGTVTVTVDDLVSYLRSHSRFTKRTKAAIARNFAGADPAQLDSAISEAKRVGKVKQYRRRRDSAELFGYIGY